MGSVTGNVTLIRGPSVLDSPAPGTASFTITGVDGVFLPTLDVPNVDTRGLAFRLDPVWPNPSHGFAVMRFALPAAGQLRVGIYDVGGRLVRELANGTFEPGEQLVTWNNRGHGARRAEPGVYFVRARFEGAGLAGSVEQRVVILD